MKVTVLYNGRPMDTYRDVTAIRHEKDGIRLMTRGRIFGRTRVFYPSPEVPRKIGDITFQVTP